ncbi:MAG TPA: hypothetical protein VN783_02870 [Thermoanaerobaculia bacterium]|nr:hypothetical protein [Thermoanaerobaculia bacterium]
MQGQADRTLYLLTWGQRCQFASRAVFNAYGFDPNLVVKEVPTAVLNAFPQGLTISH